MRTPSCIEDQGKHLVQFEGEHLTKGDAVSTEEARVYDLIADGKAPDLPDNSVDKNGLPVVKVLTNELVDELGPKILNEYFRTSSQS